MPENIKPRKLTFAMELPRVRGSILPFLNFKTSLLITLLCFCGGLSTVSSQSSVEYLPGFTGKLPFTLETGYVGVGESEKGQFFYYFIESEGDPENDPLMLWLTGGPSCSGLSGLVYEIGPMTFDLTDSDGSIPKLIYNPHSWTKAASIIFLDQPAGSGFSYAETREAYNTSDTLNSQHIYQFLRKWLLNHPKYIKHPLYIAGDSYAGLYVPLILDQVYKANDAGTEPLLNVKGYILGNPGTDSRIDGNGVYPYAHRMGLLSDKLYQSARENCNGDFYNIDNGLCEKDIQRIKECLERIRDVHILEPWCEPLWTRERSLFSLNIAERNPRKSPLSVKPTKKGCRDDNYISSYTWANNESVRKALHIREGTIGEWERCNNSFTYSFKEIESKFYKYDVSSVLAYHEKFTRRSCRALVYSGDHDMKVPHLSTEAWIDTLTLSVQSDWRPWFVQGQTAGYTTRYEHGDYSLTYATVKGAGHTAPEYKPVECLAMIQRWLSHSEL